MRFAVASDLHLDRGADVCPWENHGNADCLILAGDICEYEDVHFDPTGILEKSKSFNAIQRWFQKVSGEFDNIVWVLGNHEHYGSNIDTTEKKLKTVLEEFGVNNVSILNRSTKIVEGIKIVGATLWTDMRNDPVIQWNIQRNMADYKAIVIGEHNRRLTSEDIIEQHEIDLAFLQDAITENCIVVTHHHPSFISRVPEYRNSPIESAYHSSLDEFVMAKTPTYWVSGHTHHNGDWLIGDTHLISNCRGYYGYETIASNFNFRYFDI